MNGRKAWVEKKKRLVVSAFCSASTTAKKRVNVGGEETVKLRTGNSYRSYLKRFGLIALKLGRGGGTSKSRFGALKPSLRE